MQEGPQAALDQGLCEGCSLALARGDGDAVLLETSRGSHGAVGRTWSTTTTASYKHFLQKVGESKSPRHHQSGLSSGSAKDGGRE